MKSSKTDESISTINGVSVGTVTTQTTQTVADQTSKPNKKGLHYKPHDHGIKYLTVAIRLFIKLRFHSDDGEEFAQGIWYDLVEHPKNNLPILIKDMGKYVEGRNSLFVYFFNKVYRKQVLEQFLFDLQEYGVSTVEEATPNTAKKIKKQKGGKRKEKSLCFLLDKLNLLVLDALSSFI